MPLLKHEGFVYDRVMNPCGGILNEGAPSVGPAQSTCDAPLPPVDTHPGGKSSGKLLTGEPAHWVPLKTTPTAADSLRHPTWYEEPPVPVQPGY